MDRDDTNHGSEDDQDQTRAPIGERDDAVTHILRRGSLYVLVFSAQILLGFLVTPVLTRVLGPTEFGQFATAFAFAQLLGSIATLGLQVSVQRTYASEGPKAARGLVATSFVGVLSVTLVALLAGWYLHNSLGFSSFFGVFFFSIIWAGLSGFGQIGLAYIRSTDRLNVFLWLSGMQSFGSQILGLSLILIWKPTANVYFMGLTLGQLFTTIGVVVQIRPIPRGLLDRRTNRQAFSVSLPLLPHLVAVFFLNAGDRLVVNRDLGSFQVARYQVSYNIAALAIILLGFLNQSWEPRIFETQDPELRRSLLHLTRDVVYKSLLPLLLGLILGAPIALRLFAPPSYDPKGLIVVVLLVALSAVPYASYAASMRLLLAQGQTKNLIWIAPFAGVVNLVLNLVLVPRIGINGSALATLISYGILAALTHGVSRSIYVLPRPTVFVYSLLSLTIVGCALLSLLPTDFSFLIIRLAAGCICGCWLVIIVLQSSQPGRYRLPWSRGKHIRRR